MSDQAPRVVFLGPHRAQSLAIACKVGHRLAARTSAAVLCIHDGPPARPAGRRPAGRAAAGPADGPVSPPDRFPFLQAVFDVTGPGLPPVLVLEADHIDAETLGVLRPYLADPATTVFAAARSEDALQAAGLREYLEGAPRYDCRLAGKPESPHGRPVLIPVPRR
jgi:hypothetical protein